MADKLYLKADILQDISQFERSYQKPICNSTTISTVRLKEDNMLN